MTVTDTLGVQELSIREAYQCMFRFLDSYWERGGKSDDQIAMLLGGMALSSDGITMDPAMMSDWLEAVRAVTGKGPAPL
ncbi:hypothetical protein [Brevundimonas sp.]|uniref:hypothetical protein n=1 Tax=Brevundimonas sp. TaxID=1871086 RepID=UPI002EDA02EC